MTNTTTPHQITMKTSRHRQTRFRSACRTTPVTKPCAAPAWWPERCAQDPIPSRTRPSNAPAPMVLCLKTRESRSPPGLPSTRRHTNPIPRHQPIRPTNGPTSRRGVEQPVARQAHNLKVAGSNPAPATKHTQQHTKNPSHQAPCLRTGLSVVPSPNTTQQTRKPRFRRPDRTRNRGGEGLEARLAEQAYRQHRKTRPRDRWS